MARREAIKAQTRQRIADAARARFLAEGFDAVSVAAVARDARVSRRTFFRYFATKEAAFFANHEALIATLHQALSAPRPHESPWQTVRRALLTCAGACMDQRDVLVAQHVAIGASRALGAYDRQLDARWDDAIAAALCRGLPAGGSERRQAAWLAAALMGVVRGELRAWFEGGGRDDLVARGAAVLDWMALMVTGEGQASAAALADAA